MSEDTGSMYVAGEWRKDGAVDEIRNPYSGDVVGTVPRASAADVEAALVAAVDGAAFGGDGRCAEKEACCDEQGRQAVHGRSISDPLAPGCRRVVGCPA